jgi:uncharacterized protein YciI
MTEPCPTVARGKTPCFVVVCLDGPEAAVLRARDLDGHLAHVEKHWRRYVTAGPLRQPGGEALIGSLFLVLGEHEADVMALMNLDPYMTNGQYASITLHHFTQSIGLFLGGKIWADADSIRHRAAGGPADAPP